MHSTKNSLSKATRTKVNELLNQSLADLSDLYSQTKQAHWNVRGPSFIALHKLFDDLADACVHGLGFERGSWDLPWSGLHELSCRKYAGANEPVD